MWKGGITPHNARNISKVYGSLCCLTAILNFEPQMIQNDRQKNANGNFS